MTLIFWWYLGVFLNLATIAHNESEIVFHQVPKSLLLPYVALFVFYCPDRNRTIWKSTKSKDQL